MLKTVQKALLADFGRFQTNEALLSCYCYVSDITFCLLIKVSSCFTCHVHLLNIATLNHCWEMIVKHHGSAESYEMVTNAAKAKDMEYNIIRFYSIA